MRSSREAAAWAGLALATSLLSMTIVSAQTPTATAPTGIAQELPSSSVRALTGATSTQRQSVGFAGSTRGQ